MNEGKNSFVIARALWDHSVSNSSTDIRRHSVNETTPIWSSVEPPSLLASRHRTSGALRFPPYSVHSPLAGQHETVDVSTVGLVYSYSVIHPNPKSGAASYALGYVDLPGPLRVFARFANGAIPAVGSLCEAIPDPELGYQFVVKQQKKGD